MNRLWLPVVATALLALAACSNPQSDFQKAEAENTEAAYKAFLDKYPQGEWAQKAQAQLDNIRDTRDWESAQTADALEAYNGYLGSHPNGAHIGEARQRITELERDAAWTSAQQSGTRESYEEFLTRFPDAPQADQARSQIAALSPPPPPPPKEKPAKAASSSKSAKSSTEKHAATKSAAPPAGNYHVQVGAFSTLQAAESAKRQAEERFHTLVGSLSIQKPTGKDALYRVRSSGMSEAAAKSACQKLQAAKQACTVIKP